LWENSWKTLQGSQSGEPEQRARSTAVLNLARAAVGHPPPNSEDVLIEVIAAAQDRSVPVRRAALRLIEWFGRRPPAEAFGEHIQLVAAIVAEALSDEDVPVRCWAARALTCLGPDAIEQMERVHAAVRDSDAAVRCLACGALAKMGRNASSLAASYSASVAWSLTDGDVEVRRAAAFALAQMHDNAISYAAHIARTLKRRPAEEGGGLIEPDVEVRRLCVNTLERMGDQASSYAPELLGALESDPDVVVRRWAIRALEHAARTRQLLRADENGRPSPVKEIALRISDPDPIVRQWVLLTLARFGKDANSSSEVMRAITQALGDQEPLAVRCIAVGAAAHFNETANLAKHHSHCVAEALNSSDRELRRTGALALALIGPLQSKAAEQVFGTLADQDVVVRRGAARALEQFHSLSDLDTQKAASYIRDQDIAVRLCAIRALGQLEGQAEGYAEEICGMLTEEDSHPAVVMMARWALPRMGAQGELLMHEHRKALEAKKIQAEETNNTIGQCYRGVGDMIWNLGYTINTKVKEFLPETMQSSGRPLSPRVGRAVTFAEATIRRFKG